MSAAGGPSDRAGGETSWSSQVGSNLRGTLATLLRTPRPAGRRRTPLPGGRLMMATLLAIAAVAAAMVALDAWSLGGVRRLPKELTAVFHVVTDLGLSG